MISNFIITLNMRCLFSNLTKYLFIICIDGLSHTSSRRITDILLFEKYKIMY